MDFCPQMIPKGYKICPHKYNCNICDYHTSNIKDFKKHCGRNKHGTKWILVETSLSPYYTCSDCDFISCSKMDMNVHFMEFSHGVLSPNLSPKKKHSKAEALEKKNFPCDFCNKVYKYRSGYYRHIKVCPKRNPGGMNVYESQLKENETLINMLVKSTENNNKLCQKLLEVESQQQIIKNTITNNNTFNNQKLNINLFLNRECKDAMNLTDFLNCIQLTLDDLNYTKDNGFIKGISNIFVRNLEGMNPCQRPIHSIQDKTSQQFYIKDENKWQCDKQEDKLDRSIDSLTKKQINMIKEWEEQHPDWNNSEGGIDEYMKMVQTIMGGSTESERRFNKKIIKQGLTGSVNVSNENILSLNND